MFCCFKQPHMTRATTQSVGLTCGECEVRRVVSVGTFRWLLDVSGVLNRPAGIRTCITLWIMHTTHFQWYLLSNYIYYSQVQWKPLKVNLIKMKLHTCPSLSVMKLIKLHLLLTGTMETSEGELNQDEVTHMSLTISDEAYQTTFITHRYNGNLWRWT